MLSADRKKVLEIARLFMARSMQAVMSGDRYALYNLASNDATVAMGVRGWTYLSLMFLPRWPNSAPYFTPEADFSIL